MASVAECLSAVARSAKDGERSVASAVDDCGDVGCGEVSLVVCLTRVPSAGSGRDGESVRLWSGRGHA